VIKKEISYQQHKITCAHAEVNISIFICGYLPLFGLQSSAQQFPRVYFWGLAQPGVA